MLSREKLHVLDESVIQSISLGVHCGSSQFMSYLFHCHRFVVVLHDGLVFNEKVQFLVYCLL